MFYYTYVSVSVSVSGFYLVLKEVKAKETTHAVAVEKGWCWYFLIQYTTKGYIKGTYNREVQVQSEKGGK